MDAITRHERIAFQFSGGKDSTAALLWLRPFWDKLTVYYCDSGDAAPGITAVVAQMAALVPVVVVPGRTGEVKARWGLPTDLLPWSSAYAAHHSNVGITPLLQDRVACCSRSIMAPLHERMVSDGITLIIRGQKQCDEFRGELRSGDVRDGIEFLYPVQDWTDDDCIQYMNESGFSLPAEYSEGLTHSGDCITCTAWCSDSRGEYLRSRHPEKFIAYSQDMRVIARALGPSLDGFRKELEVCNGNAI